MIGATGVYATVILLLAVAVLVWPSGGGLRRLRVAGSRSAPDPAVVRIRVADLAADSPRRLAVLVGAAAVVAGLLVGGPVAAVVLLTYSALGVRALVRRVRGRRAAVALAALLDDLCGLASDLRAGLPPAASATVAGPARSGHGTANLGRIRDLTAAVWRLAERTGAPAADLVERIETDARTADRAKASAAAEAAGAQLTAMLLAALPLGGIALGYSLGADPVDVLLHSPLGAGCAIGAVLLQSAGLLWTDRLMSGATR